LYRSELRKPSVEVEPCLADALSRIDALRRGRGSLRILLIGGCLDLKEAVPISDHLVHVDPGELIGAGALDHAVDGVLTQAPGDGAFDVVAIWDALALALEPVRLLVLVTRGLARGGLLFLRASVDFAPRAEARAPGGGAHAFIHPRSSEGELRRVLEALDLEVLQAASHPDHLIQAGSSYRGPRFLAALATGRGAGRHSPGAYLAATRP
jgi:hypothetical protein